MARDLALRADCSRCAALCCVSLHIDPSPAFAIGKAAGEPCGHLGLDNRCAIHAERAPRGFAGCASYDCLGAGQRVTRLFEGRSWRTDPALLAAMSEAFFLVRRLHELLELLLLARRLPLSDDQRRTWRALWRGLAPPRTSTWVELERLELDPIERQLRSFLGSLRPHVASGPRRRLPIARAQPRRMLTPPSTSSALPVVKLEASDTR